MHVFGLTGGLASGKSTVAARFRARGLPIIDADEVAREVVAPESEGLSAVVAVFGKSVLDDFGSLDRKKLAAEVFAEPTRRNVLNGILHPRIAAKSAQKMRELDATGEPLACYEAALLVENGLENAFRPLVVVSAPLDLQLERARLRDGKVESEGVTRGRLAAQMPLSEKVPKADFVIDNGGTIAALYADADAVLDAICERLGVDPGRYAACALITD